MNKREFLSAILTKNPPEPVSLPAIPPPDGGLAPYNGPWTENEAIHLLKRTMFGATRSDTAYFVSLGFEQSIDTILTAPATLPAPPVKEYESDTDAQVIGGTTWINDPSDDGTLNSLRRASFKKWWMGLMLRQNRNILEKMTLFWHNHWSTESAIVENARYVYTHHTLLRSMALGNFRTMAKAVTTDPAMLVYQNGQLNTKQAPDENYGRELQELFSVGKGPGSQYTEDDVKAAAKVLTGWRIDPATVTSYFTEARHDTGNKTFSAFYNNTVIQGKSGPTAGDEEVDAMLDMIFSTQEVAKYICRRLYRWFVYYDIDSTVEANIITPLADIFRNNHYEIRPVLETLLKSEHFFNALAKGCQIKSPVDLVVSACREFNMVFPSPVDYVSSYGMYAYLVTQAALMQQNIGDPPDVSGWKAYYQAPQFYEIWINSDTLPKRNFFTDTIITNGYMYNGQRIEIDGAAFAKTLSNPGDPNQLIDDILKVIYRIDISAASKAQLKTDILLGGQTSDYYWTGAWNTYISNPDDMSNTTTVENRLRDLLKYFMDLSEYQLA